MLAVYISKAILEFIKQMLRVFLRVSQVSIQVKENADVQICIRRGRNGFVSPTKFTLQNGEAKFHHQIEFFIDSQDPVFEINVLLFYCSMKKLAGTCSVNLNHWEQNAGHEMSLKLQRSPDPHASIQFDFVYVSAAQSSPKKGIYTINDLEKQKQIETVQKYEKTNKDLSLKNELLSSELELLKMENSKLKQLKEEMDLKSQKNEQQLDKLSNQKKQADETLTMMKNKLEKMMSEVRNSDQRQLGAQLLNFLEEMDK